MLQSLAMGVLSARKLRSKGRGDLQLGRWIVRRRRKKLPPALGAELALRNAALAAALRAKDAEGTRREGERLAALLGGKLNPYRPNRVWWEIKWYIYAGLFVLTLRVGACEHYFIPSGSMLPTLQAGDRVWVNKASFGLRVPFTYEPPHKVWNGRTPERGEVVVFMHPNEPGRDMVKRVLAVQGDTIRFRDGQVFLRKRGDSQFAPIERRPQGRVKVCDYEAEGDAWRLQESDAFEERIGGATYLALGRSDPPDLPGHESFRQALADTRRRAPGAAVDAIRDTFGPIPEGHVFMVGDNREYSEDSRYWGTVPYEYLKGPALFNIYSYGAQPEESCANEGFFSRIRWGRFFRSVD